MWLRPISFYERKSFTYFVFQMSRTCLNVFDWRNLRFYNAFVGRSGKESQCIFIKLQKFIVVFLLCEKRVPHLFWRMKFMPLERRNNYMKSCIFRFKTGFSCPMSLTTQSQQRRVYMCFIRVKSKLACRYKTK